MPASWPNTVETQIGRVVVVVVVRVLVQLFLVSDLLASMCSAVQVGTGFAIRTGTHFCLGFEFCLCSTEICNIRWQETGYQSSRPSLGYSHNTPIPKQYYRQYKGHTITAVSQIMRLKSRKFRMINSVQKVPINLKKVLMLRTLLF